MEDTDLQVYSDVLSSLHITPLSQKVFVQGKEKKFFFSSPNELNNHKFWLKTSPLFLLPRTLFPPHLANSLLLIHTHLLGFCLYGALLRGFYQFQLTLGFLPYSSMGSVLLLQAVDTKSMTHICVCMQCPLPGEEQLPEGRGPGSGLPARPGPAEAWALNCIQEIFKEVNLPSPVQRLISY